MRSRNDALILPMRIAWAVSSYRLGFMALGCGLKQRKESVMGELKQKVEQKFDIKQPAGFAGACANAAWRKDEARLKFLKGASADMDVPDGDKQNYEQVADQLHACLVALRLLKNM